MPKLIPNIKETIVLEARKILIESGYKSFNMRDIAKQSGIGVGTLYNYFSDKDELVREVFIDDWNKAILTVKSLETYNASLKSKINEMYLSINKFLENYLVIFLEMAYSSNVKKCDNADIMNPMYVSMEAILLFHRNLGEVHSEVPLDKLAHFIVSNLVALCREKYISFDDLYSCFNL